MKVYGHTAAEKLNSSKHKNVEKYFFLVTKTSSIHRHNVYRLLIRTGLSSTCATRTSVRLTQEAKHFICWRALHRKSLENHRREPSMVHAEKHDIKVRVLTCAEAVGLSRAARRGHWCSMIWWRQRFEAKCNNSNSSGRNLLLTE